MGQDNRNKGTETPQKMRVVFGFIMVLIYLAMGYLCFFTELFSWMLPWARIGLGVIFTLYGFWRGYRQVKNMN